MPTRKSSQKLKLQAHESNRRPLRSHTNPSSMLSRCSKVHCRCRTQKITPPPNHQYTYKASKRGLIDCPSSVDSNGIKIKSKLHKMVSDIEKKKLPSHRHRRRGPHKLHPSLLDSRPHLPKKMHLGSHQVLTDH